PPDRSRHGRRERADSRAGGMARLWRMETFAVWRHACLWRRRRAFLHAPKEHHATLAREHRQGGRVRDADDPLSTSVCRVDARCGKHRTRRGLLTSTALARVRYLPWLTRGIWRAVFVLAYVRHLAR